jgi:predicted MFS family arabinose efflux permease
VLLAVFAVWEHRAAAPMVPPALLRARSFAASCLVYVLSTAGLTGAMFYLTLLYQDVHGWSVLRTGLSWLFMNIPFLIIARQAGRMHDRLSSAAIVGAGCLIAGISLVVLSVLDASTPFVVAAAGYVLWGLGFGTSMPGISHVAIRDVPSAVSGAASGVLNASRQVGTSVGLAVLGAIGTGATVSDWTARVSGFPAAARAAASGQAQNVAGARVASVTAALGPRYRDAAVRSFVHGYHLAVGAGAACLLAAALIAFIGLRTRPGSRQPGTPTADARLDPDPGQGVRSGQA